MFSERRTPMRLEQLPVPKEQEPEIRIVTLEKGQKLYQQDEPADALHIVTQGRIALERYKDIEKKKSKKKTRKRTTLSLIGPGDMTGWDSFLDKTHTQTAVAEETSRVVTIPFSIITDILSKDGELAMQFGQIISQEINRAQNKEIIQRTGDVKAKVAHALLSYLRFADEEDTIPVSHNELINFANVSRQSVTGVAIPYFVRKGWIRQKRESNQTNIRIVSANRLRGRSQA